MERHPPSVGVLYGDAYLMDVAGNPLRREARRDPRGRHRLPGVRRPFERRTRAARHSRALGGRAQESRVCTLSIEQVGEPGATL